MWNNGRMNPWLRLLPLVVAAAGCGVSTEPFRAPSGDVVPESVAVMERVVIGGVPQQLWFRGRDRRAPALLLLHGGPGASEAALFRHYNAELENHYLVVYWEQRGAGRSFDADLPRDSMTMAQFQRDLGEVVDLVRRRFGQPKVVLLGHSWGTAVGLVYASEHPDRVAAFVGTGQVADMPQGELVSWEFARAEARRRGDDDALAELDEIGPPPHTVDEMLVSRKWVERFGGSFAGELTTGSLIWAALGTDEAGVWDLVLFGRGNRFSLELLWPEFSTFSALPRRRFAVPIFFLLGRRDWQVPATVAAAYFETIEAPCKRLVWFESSAHNPPFEEARAFDRVLIDEVLPVVRGGPCPGAAPHRR